MDGAGSITVDTALDSGAVGSLVGVGDLVVVLVWVWAGDGAEDGAGDADSGPHSGGKYNVTWALLGGPEF